MIMKKLLVFFSYTMIFGGQCILIILGWTEALQMLRQSNNQILESLFKPSFWDKFGLYLGFISLFIPFFLELSGVRFLKRKSIGA